MKINNLLCMGLIFVVAGCAAEENADKARTTAAQPISKFQHFEFNVPPKQLLETARKVASGPGFGLGIESENKGVIVTGWKQYQGAYHIVRYWQERTRYQIVISPDFDDPTGKSSLQVSQETQTRATDGQRWYTLLDEDRTNRAVELADAIRKAAGG